MRTTADYTAFGGSVVEYDNEAPCRVCGEPVVYASMGGTDVCQWCDMGVHRDGSEWTFRDAWKLVGPGATPRDPLDTL
jgi:hypothetical protein